MSCGNRKIKYHKIPKISPGSYIFQRPFWRGLCTEGNLRFKIDWASLWWEGNLPFFALFYFVFKGKIQVQAPRGAYIQRGDLSEGFLRYDFGGLYLEGLIHGGAYFRNFTVERKFKVFEVNKYCNILLIFSAFFHSLFGLFVIGNV